MANCVRFFIEASVEQVKTILGEEPSVVRFGRKPIRPASESYFSEVHPTLEKFTEVNALNGIKDIRTKIGPNIQIYFQDLDGYGIDQYFKVP